jgi:hypothetical protein
MLLQDVREYVMGNVRFAGDELALPERMFATSRLTLTLLIAIAPSPQNGVLEELASSLRGAARAAASGCSIPIDAFLG